ncbi:hypothetical protein ElyMa_002646000 [Elysia marginata]|uniref:Uncharacterized protein n=1 Tax=Elysia marginata TaxID=1093978 RepID=A0AAV4H5N4_9GAST|nr:hypothetical protein ElyMa_002646000 [Elysia marginata]
MHTFLKKRKKRRKMCFSLKETIRREGGEKLGVVATKTRIVIEIVSVSERASASVPNEIKQAPADDDNTVFHRGTEVTRNCLCIETSSSSISDITRKTSMVSVEILSVDDDNVLRNNFLGSVGFTADDWLTGPVSPSAILDFLRFGLRPPVRAGRA